jgi:hypothetical protein
LWQLAQPDVIPVWLNAAPAKLAVLLWQVSHDAVVGRCFAGFPLAVLPLWQLAQSDTIPV